MLFSWLKAEEDKPVPDRTCKTSAWTWAYISFSHILPIKVSYMVKLDKGVQRSRLPTRRP